MNNEDKGSKEGHEGDWEIGRCRYCRCFELWGILPFHMGQLFEYRQCKKVDKNAVEKVDGDVEAVISCEIISSKVIVEREADIGHRAPRQGTFKPGIVPFAKTQVLDPNKWVLSDVLDIIKDKGSFQSVAITKNR